MADRELTAEVEAVARALCRIRIERNMRGVPGVTEDGKKRGEDHAWREFKDEAEAAIAAMSTPIIGSTQRGGVIEECAKIADAFESGSPDQVANRCAVAAAQTIAHRIRALSASPTAPVTEGDT